MRGEPVARSGSADAAAGPQARHALAPDPRGSLFEPGRNCYAVAHADRVALLVDGEAYFRAFAAAAERATAAIHILAWDFNSHTRLHFDPVGHREPPACLGEFLNWLARRRHGLRIRILDWDYPMVFGTDREFPPLYGLGWKPHHRVEVAYDNTHPLSGSHHQKIVVIDDCMAFIGGFDLTDRRWDTCEHRADDERRTYAGTPYPPFHDLMMAVDGEAARVLASIVRARWLHATGQALKPVLGRGDPWPPRLAADLADVEAAFARTLPASAEHAEVREVETLYLDMIAAARERIYIENQYFTAHRIGEALEARLLEDDGPEIVLVVRLFSHGWLEEHTMHVLRTRLIEQLRSVDHHQRFHVHYAHVEGLGEGLCIDLHSKLMIVDDEILRIGSANLCNRSMGMDSECDAAIEARGEERVRGVIRGFRNRLLAEHLDTSPERVDAEVERCGSLNGAIEALRGGRRTLRPLDRMPAWPEPVLDLARVADPERPVSLEQLIETFTPEASVDLPAVGARPLMMKLTMAAIVLAALTALWRYTPLAQWIDPARISLWADTFADRPWAPLVVIGAYTPACVVMFPRPLITLGAVVAFGPVLGFVYAVSGILFAAWLTYVVGRRLPRRTVRHLAGPQLNRITDTLRRRGLIAVTALRLVPIAPFAVEGLVAGAIHIRPWHFMLGTFLGLLPGTLAATIFGGELEAALHDPARINYGLLGAIVLTLVLLSLAVRRWFINQNRSLQHHGQTGQPAR